MHSSSETLALVWAALRGATPPPPPPTWTRPLGTEPDSPGGCCLQGGVRSPRGAPWGSSAGGIAWWAGVAHCSDPSSCHWPNQLEAGQPWRVLAAPQLWLCARGEGIATELGSERGCVCLGAAPRLVWTGLASGLPRGPSGRGSLCLGSQVGLARGPEAVGHFPEAVLGSDSPVTVETETPSRLFQCVSPFPGRASPCHSSARPAPPRRLGPALWETGLQGRPGIPGRAPACVRGGGRVEPGLTLKPEPEVRGHSVLSGRPGSFLLCG